MYKILFVQSKKFKMASWIREKYDLVVANRTAEPKSTYIFIINSNISIDELSEFLNVFGFPFILVSSRILSCRRHVDFGKLKDFINQWNS